MKREDGGHRPLFATLQCIKHRKNTNYIHYDVCNLPKNIFFYIAMYEVGQKQPFSTSQCMKFAKNAFSYIAMYEVLAKSKHAVISMLFL